MENSKENIMNEKTSDENPNPNNPNPNNSETETEVATDFVVRQSSRRPFTSLSQVDADLALAHALQEQERAYVMLTMNGHRIDHYSSDEESYVYQDNEVEGEDDQIEEESIGNEDAFEAQERETVIGDLDVDIDSSFFDNDGSYARALQDAEEREMALRLLSLAGISNWEEEDPEDNRDNFQDDTWLEVDPDELSYEELIALGEVVGTESRGLSIDSLASLPSLTYQAKNAPEGNSDQCIICRLDYVDGETLTILQCKHLYHPECINNWLQINKVCPICNTEVSTSTPTLPS